MQAAGALPMCMYTGLSIPGYSHLRHIGQGAFGVVYEGTDVTSGEKHALKVLRVAGYAMNEIEALSGLPQHPHVIKYIRSIILSDSSTCIAMEYCSGGTLKTQLMYLFQPDICRDLRFMREIASAVAFLHQYGVVHRDLKPDNILLSANGTLKVADFGLAKIITDSKCSNLLSYYMGTQCGTPYYMAPEVYSGHYTFKSDMFSMGVIFARISQNTTSATNALMPHMVHAVSKEYSTLVGNLQEHRPDLRPTAGEVVSMLGACGCGQLVPRTVMTSGVGGWFPC